MQQKNKPHWLEDAITTAIAAIPAAFVFFFMVLIGKVLWPCVKWSAAKVLALLRNKAGKAPTAQVVSKQKELPTPDIFKGASNLAPAKQLKF